MAGRGRPPKTKETRTRRHAPAAGEWTELPAVDPKKPHLPVLPTRKRDLDDDPVGKWHPRTREAWKAWRLDPATTQFGPAEIAGAISLAYIYDEWVRGKASLASEARLRETDLGLNLKGKQDRRWRSPTQTVTEAESPAPVAKLADVRRLKAV